MFPPSLCFCPASLPHPPLPHCFILHCLITSSSIDSSTITSLPHPPLSYPPLFHCLIQWLNYKIGGGGSLSILGPLRDPADISRGIVECKCPPPPLSRDRRIRGGAMSHSIDRLFPLLTIHRVGVEIVDCQACPVDCFSTMWYGAFLFPACHPLTPAG